MKFLCNLPLECFANRDTFGEHQILSYGPADRMWVDNSFYAFDVTFDPSEESIHALLQRLPADFQPDALLLYWPDQEPLPAQLEECPFPTIGVVSDYNLSLPYITGLWPFFDLLLVDRPGVSLFSQLSFANVQQHCQFTFKQPSHHLMGNEPRDLDLVFVGNLNPAVQWKRKPWIDRLVNLPKLGIRTEIKSGIYGEDYGRLLNRAKIGFNHSVRGEMNLRAFEVPACGAVLFMEESNQEVRDFLVPDEEVILYNENNLEQLLLQLLADEPRRQKIAQAGHRKIQQFGMGNRLAEVAGLLQSRQGERTHALAYETALGRGTAMLNTWAMGEGLLRGLQTSHQLTPEDPRPLNALALANFKVLGQAGLGECLRLLNQACAVSHSYIPAALNLTFLLQSMGEIATARRSSEMAAARLALAPQWRDLDGPILPLGYAERSILTAHALGEAIRNNRRQDYASHLSAMTQSEVLAL